jgi:uncharacterized membrane protein YebE (DUF533 family)
MPETIQRIVVVFIFTACAAVIALASQPDTGNSIVQLLILAGIVVNFMDGHTRTKATNAKIDENTAITAKTEQHINGKTEDLIRAASQAAYAKGLLDGEEKERQRQKDTLSNQPQP